MVNFKNEQEFAALEKEAYFARLDISDFPAAEYRYFDRLEKIGRLKRFEHYPDDIIRRKKEQAYRDYQSDVYNLKLQFKAFEGYQNNILKAKQRTSDIQKAKPEDKLVLALQCIEALLGERGFAERAIKYYERAKEK